MSSLFTASASPALVRPLADAHLAAASAKTGFSVSGAVVLFIVIAVLALLVVSLLGIRMRRSPGLLSPHRERIKEAAAADVAAIEEDGKFVSPDAPGRHEDDL
jgi:hypothetical protein